MTQNYRAMDINMQDVLAPTEPRFEPAWRQRRIPSERISKEGFSALLVDLDGTLMVGGQSVSGARELVESCGHKMAVLTNNSGNTPQQIARQLRRAGLVIRPDRVFTAGCLLIETLAKTCAGAPVLALLSNTMKRYARQAGVQLVDGQDAEVVAIGRMQSLTYRHIQDAANAVADGAKILAANPDFSHPNANGGIVPETGAIVASIEAAAGKVRTARFVGKPEPGLAWRALEKLSCVSATNVLVVGDNPATDGRLARVIGAQYLAVE